MKKGSPGKSLGSFRYAWKGIVAALKGEFNLRIHLAVALLVIAAGFWFNLSHLEWIIITLCCTSVIGAELFNSVIERLTDLVSPGNDHRAGTIKDMSAAAVLVMVIGSVIAGLIIFLPKW